MPSKQKALFLTEAKGKWAVQETDVPTPGPGELLVEVQAAGLNPMDRMIQATGRLIENYPAIMGFDAGSIVKEVGEGVTKFKVGDRILHSGTFKNRNGTYQQYSIVPADVAAKIPDSLTFDQAATIPLPIQTAVFGLYNPRQEPFGGAGLTSPWAADGRGKYAGQAILVFGGATTVGQYVIQLAKLSGFSPIITTASLHNEAFLKSLGATHVFDRKAPVSELPAKIKAVTQAPFKVVFDIVSEPETQNVSYEHVLSPGGALVISPSPAVEESKITPEKAIVKVVADVQIASQRETGVAFYSHLTALLESGEIKPNNVEVIPGGLAGVEAGLEKLQNGISALKLVVHPQETA